MTTFATALGVLPLLTAFGAGANARFAIGLMIAAACSWDAVHAVRAADILPGDGQTPAATADRTPTSETQQLPEF
jgi:hypothetical protein